MTTVSPIDRKRPPMLCLGCVALSLFWISPAAAQQADQLEQQLKELKQEYEATTQVLQCAWLPWNNNREPEGHRRKDQRGDRLSGRFGGRTCG